MKDSPSIESPALQPMVKVRPMLMFTGFLGAGKTTLLRELLGCLAVRGVLSDVILNDRENAYIDKATLDDYAADVRALTGSCVCCEGLHDLIDGVMKASQSKHELLLIELNGTSDPLPLQESFTVLEAKFRMFPRWQVCVIDARHFRKRTRFNDLENLQLETASHYYISWGGELTDLEILSLEGEIRAVNPRAIRTSAPELAEVISLAIKRNTGHALVAKKADESSGKSLDFGFTSALKGDEDERHKLAHEFTGCHIIVPKPVDESRIENWLGQLPASVIRAKALLTLSSDTTRLSLYERVGQVTSPHSIRTQRKGGRSSSGVFIGTDLDPQEILKLSKELLHPECYLSE